MTTTQEERWDPAPEEAVVEEPPERPEVNARVVDEVRTVFTEDGNCDGWIATDSAVEPWQ